MIKLQNKRLKNHFDIANSYDCSRKKLFIKRLTKTLNFRADLHKLTLYSPNTKKNQISRIINNVPVTAAEHTRVPHQKY